MSQHIITFWDGTADGPTTFVAATIGGLKDGILAHHDFNIYSHDDREIPGTPMHAFWNASTVPEILDAIENIIAPAFGRAFKLHLVPVGNIVYF